MGENGSCPTCGRVLSAAAAVSNVVNQPDATMPYRPEDRAPYDAKTINVRDLAGEEGRAPWHFKLLVLAVVGYLLWRVVQLVAWVL
jgi:hypothetical protein